MTALVATAAIAMMLTALMPALAVPGSSFGTLTGTVSDINDGEPIEGARVEVHYHGILRIDITDSAGKYRIDNIPECFCLKTINVTKDGYRPESKDVAVDGVTVVDFELLHMELEPYTGSIVGTVTDEHDGTPLEGARIVLEYHETLRETYTDSEGKYTFGQVPECYCLKKVSATKEGYRPESQDVGVSGVTAVDFQLMVEEQVPPAGTVTGKVTDAQNGEPIEGALTELQYNGHTRTSYTDAEGWYLFENVPEDWNPKTIKATKDGYRPASKEFDVEGFTVVDIELLIEENEPETGSISGTVTDADTGEPVEGAWVTIEFHGATKAALTDSEGRYALDGIPICRCLKNVTVEKAGYDILSALVGVGESTVKDFELEPVDAGPDGGTITGVVTDAGTGEPIEGAKVTVSYHETLRTATTDSDGRYTVTGVPECFCLKEVKVSMDGYHGQSKSVGVYGTTVVDFALQPRETGGDGSASGITGGGVAGGMTGQQLAVSGLLGGVLVLVVLVVYMIITARRKQEL